MGALDVIDDFSLKLGMNAEVDTMGGSVENVVNVIKVSSRDEVFENVQEELKEQLLYRDLAQRELEFLESGGDPLDFRFRHTPSVSVQSTSLTGQLQEQIVTSKAKSDISLIGTMAHSDEPTLQQRKLVSDANDVEIISSFDGNNLLADAENNSIQLHNISSLEQSSRVEGTQDAKESEESTIFRPYTRRIRSKPTHNLSSSESTDVLPSRGSVHAPVPSRFGLRETDGSVLDSNHIDQNNSSCLVKKSTRPNPDETHTVVDASKPNPKCSSSVEAWAGLPKNSSDEGSLPALTSVVPKVHFDDANRTLDDESTKVIVGKSLLGNGCMHSEDYNENDDVVVETESRCVQENSQGEVEKGMSKYANECDTGQIAFVDDKADHQNNFEKNSNVRTPEMSEMVNEFQEGARISTVSSGTESNYPAMSGIFSVHGNVSVSDTTLEIEGSATAERVVHEISLANSCIKSSVDASEPQTGCTNELQKVNEDAILAEALLIEAKRKKISQLLTRTFSSEKHPKSHWDFVLEEMAWLANDFMQERIWKISAAAQFGHCTALASCQRVEQNMPIIKLKAAAQSISRDVLKFWQSVESGIHNEDRKTSVCDKSLLPFEGNDAVEDQTEEFKVVQELKSMVEEHRLIKNPTIREYAMRFLKFNATIIPYFDADARSSDGLKCSLETKDEENLFYDVPAGAMESYRNAVESHVLQFEISGGGLQEAERSLYEASEENTCSGEEDEQDTCYSPNAFEGNQAFKAAQKKRKNLSNTYASGMYVVGADFNFGRQGNDFYSRRVPKKRFRTAPRQMQHSDWTDPSSEDTDSFQDDQTEYAVKMEKHLILDVEGDLSRIKNKKYPKYLKQRGQDKTHLPDGQRDVFKKRINNQQLKRTRVDGTIRPPNAKRSKIPKQQLENSFESHGLGKGMVPSDVASQMKNIPHPSQIMRIIGVQGHARKAKSVKGPSGLSGSRNLWTSFEDQALVVLVHDLGPNWNLVGDALNSALQFVYIFRKPYECMERHKILMDKTTDDAADSAEDSVSSQPYPSTLPGIPKGSARQLFQHLQGPLEEDTLKSHFEKIMLLTRKQHFRKIKNVVHDHKQVVPNHNSHVTALSEVSSNYLYGDFLTPLELCDLPLSNLDSITVEQQLSVRPPGDNSLCQGTPGVVTGSNSPRPMGPLGASVRDGKYGASRPSTPTNEQQKLNSMSTQQSSSYVCGTPSVTDRNAVCLVRGVTSTGMVSGSNSQSLPISRLGFQGTNLPPTPITGGTPISGVIGMQNHINPRVNCSQGTSKSNSSGTYTTLNQESQRLTTAPELYTRATLGNNHGTASPSDTSSTFSGLNSPPMGQIHHVQNQRQHQRPPQQSPGLNHHPRIRGPSILQQPSYARMIKEQHLQQQLMQQQQLSALIPARPNSQSSMIPQITPLAPIVLPHSPAILASQPQQTRHLSPQGRHSSHPLQQSGGPRHPYHPQLAQPQQLAKLANGPVTENISTSQNGTDNSSHRNRISSTARLSADQLASVHGEPAQTVRPQVTQSLGRSFQQKQFHNSVPPTNPVQQTPPNSENGSQNKVLPRSSAERSSKLQSAKSGGVAGRKPQSNKKSESLQKNGNKSLDNTEKEMQQNHLGNSDQQPKGSTDPPRPGALNKNSIPSSDSPAALSHVTGSTGRASVNSPSSILLGTESELYDSILQNFDNEMQTAAKPTKKPSAIKPDSTGNKGVILQRQSSSGKIPSEWKSSQQPDTHCTELEETLSTQPTIK